MAVEIYKALVCRKAVGMISRGFCSASIGDSSNTAGMALTEQHEDLRKTVLKVFFSFRLECFKC